MRFRTRVICMSLCCWMVQAGAQQIVLENAAVRRTFADDADAWRTARVTNLLTGHDLPAESLELRLVLARWPGRAPVAVLTGTDFRPKGAPVRRGLDDGGQALTVELTSAAHGVALRVHYEAPAGVPWQRKRLDLAGPDSLMVAELALETFTLRPDVSAEEFPGLGQPVYVGREFFLGVEHPGSGNTVEEGSVTCGYRPAMRLRAGWQPSKSCVLGAATDQPRRRVSDAFLRYIAHHRPQPLRPFLLWESWMTSYAPGADVCEQLSRQLKADYADRGVRLDCFLLSAWWEDMQSVWKPDAELFPEGLAPAVEAVRRNLETPVGLWFPLAGGKLDRRWGAKQGYEVIGLDAERPLRGQYCIGGPEYHAEYKRTLVDTVRQHQIAALKMDFVAFRCNRTDHGHLPGDDSVVGMMDNYLDIVAALREVNPDVVIYPTTGINQSPWWLFHVDAVWRGGSDYYIPREVTPPVPHCRALVTTYVDHVLYRQFREQRKQYPLSSLMDHGILTAPQRPYLGKLGTPDGDPLLNFCHDAVLHVLRGSFLRELYVPPASLTDQYKDLLAAVLRWSQAPAVSAVVLGNTRQVLGSPAKLEVYGYAHVTPQNRALIAVRNPSVETQPVGLVLDETAGMTPDGLDHHVVVVYPYRQVLDHAARYGSILPLAPEGLEVLVLEILPASEAGRWPVGCRFEHEPGGATCRTWGRAGTVVGGEGAGTLTFPGKPRAPTVRSEGWRAETGEAVLDMEMTVPDGVAEPELWLDLRVSDEEQTEPAGGGELRVTVTVDGEPADASVRQAPPWPWRYVQVPLPARGSLGVRVALSRAAMRPRGATARVLLRYTEALVAGARVPVQAGQPELRLPLLPQLWARESRPTVAVLPETELVLAAGAGTFASSFDGRYPPDAAFDGSRGTFWCATGKQGQWLARRFAVAQQVAGIEVDWYGAWKVRHYRVEAWRDDAWRAVVKRENTDPGKGALRTHDTFAPVTTDAVRIVVEDVHAPSANTAIREIRLLR